MNALSIIPVRHPPPYENQAKVPKTKRTSRNTSKTTHSHTQGGRTSVGERRNGFNARYHSANASVKRSVGSHHASSPPFTRRLMKKQIEEENSNDREKITKGTELQLGQLTTHHTRLSAGLLCPQWCALPKQRGPRGNRCIVFCTSLPRRNKSGAREQHGFTPPEQEALISVCAHAAPQPWY